MVATVCVTSILKLCSSFSERGGVLFVIVNACFLDDPLLFPFIAIGKFLVCSSQTQPHWDFHWHVPVTTDIIFVCDYCGFLSFRLESTFVLPSTPISNWAYGNFNDKKRSQTINTIIVLAGKTLWLSMTDLSSVWRKGDGIIEWIALTWANGYQYLRDPTNQESGQCACQPLLWRTPHKEG